jgi:hypothetical protein
LLSASKTDTAALSVEVEMACLCCTLHLRAELCPVCCLKLQVKLVAKTCSPGSLAEARLPPLVPTASGGRVSKKHMVSFINEIAASTGASAETRSGAQKWGGPRGAEAALPSRSFGGRHYRHPTPCPPQQRSYTGLRPRRQPFGGSKRSHSSWVAHSCIANFGSWLSCVGGRILTGSICRRHGHLKPVWG